MKEEYRSDRREFIKKSGLLATALSLGAAPAITANPQESYNLVRVGWIGTGSRANHLMKKVVRLPNVEITALCDLWPPNLEAAKGNCANPNVRTYQDHQELVEKEKDIDCAIVTTPLHMHAQQSVDAMKAGRHVFCEKTMTRTVEEANEMVKVSRETKKFVQVGLQRRYSPIYRKAIHMIFNEGLLGRITLIRCQWHRNTPWGRAIADNTFPSGKEYEIVRRHYPDRSHWFNWRLYWDYSGGLMTELGSHQLDVCSWALGCHPTAVVGVGGKDYWKDDRQVFDNVQVIYEFEIKPNDQNRKAFFSSEPTPLVEEGRFDAQETLRRMKEEPYVAKVIYSSIGANAHDGAAEQIMGDRGTILLTTTKGLFFEEPAGPKLAWGTKAMSKEEAAARDALVITSGATHDLSMEPQQDEGQPFAKPMVGMDFEDVELADFFENVVRNGRRPYCDVEKGRNDAVMVLMANEAMKQGKRLEIPESLYI